MWRSTHVVLGLALTACAASTSTSDGARFTRAPARNAITATEIVAARVSDVYQAVSQLRPDFLRRRARSVTPGMRPTAVSVYLDEVPFGGVESLRQIPLDRVRVIRYYGPFDAELRWGGSHPAGAILVTTQKTP